MGGRRELILDTAIGLLGDSGVHAVTHRAVDGAAGLAAGSTSNYFRSRDALLEAVVERFAARAHGRAHRSASVKNASAFAAST